MSGVVKAVKKVFKSVVNVVKKIWKPLLIAAAVYFTAGLALSAFAPTASFAASMPGFAGGGVLGTGVGAGASAGTGIFSTAAAKMGLGALGASGGLAGGAMAAGTSASALGAAGFSTAAIAEGASAVVGSTLAAGDAVIGAAGAAGAAGGGVGAVGGAATGAGGGSGTVAAGGATTSPSLAMGGVGTGAKAAGMTLGEKLLLASSGTQALGVLMGEDPADAKKWQGAYFGVQYSGEGPGPTVGGPATGQPDPANKAKLADTGKPVAPNLFEQQVQGKPAPAAPAPTPQSSGDLFQAKNPKVRYV